MKISNIILITSSILILYSCGGEPNVKIDDKWNPTKYSTDLFTLNDETNRPIYNKMSAYDLGKIIDEDKTILDTLKTMKYKEAITYLVDYERGRPARELKQLKEQLEREIESLKDGFDGSGFRSDITSIQIELAVFEVWKNLCKKAKESNDKEVNKLGENLKEQVSKIQTKEFPQLRKAYGEVANKLMWESNIEVKTGNSKTQQNLTFIGGVFANNKNIKEVQTQVSEITNILRFKTVNYLWYKSQDDYTYYDLKPKKDSDL